MKHGIDIGYFCALIFNRRIIKITSPFFITLLLLLLFFGSIGGASAALSGSVIAPASVNVCESTGFFDASISINKTVYPSVGEVCTDVTFTIVVNNTGNATLDPVIVTDTLPLGLNYVSSDPTGALSGNVVVWNLGSMDPGEMRIVNLVAHINGSAFGELQNVVHGSSVKKFKLHIIIAFHKNYALPRFDPISRWICCSLFGQADLTGLATGIAA